MTNAADQPPRLAPPGAGIPAVERFVGGAIFAFRRWRGTRETFSEEFTAHRDRIARLYAAHDDQTLASRVLIPRLRGIEDSSRFWSVYMTLDHLRIVNDQITGVIDALTRGVVPPGQASTAAVKPSPGASSAVVPQYEASCDRFLTLTKAKDNLRTHLRYAHPWFGPLDAAGWHSMAATHMGIHQAQIARILA